MSKSPFNPISEEKNLEYIYDDVDDTDIFALKSHEEDNREKEQAAESVPVTTTSVELPEHNELLEKNKQLEARLAVLETRISELYFTAKAELDRKDKRIRELNQEKNDILFRRRKIYHPNLQQTKVNRSEGIPVNNALQECKATGINDCRSDDTKIRFGNSNLTLNSEANKNQNPENVKTMNKSSNNSSKEAPKNINIQDTKNNQSTFPKNKKESIQDKKIVIEVSDSSDTEKSNQKNVNLLDKLQKSRNRLNPNTTCTSESNNKLSKTSSQKNGSIYPKDPKKDDIKSKEIQISLTDVRKVIKEKPFNEVKTNNHSQKCDQNVEQHKEVHSTKNNRKSADTEKVSASNAKRDKSKNSNNVKDLPENSANLIKSSNQCEAAEKKFYEKELAPKGAHKKHQDEWQKHSTQLEKDIEESNKETHKKYVEHKDVPKGHQHEREKPLLKYNRKDRDKHHGSASRTAGKIECRPPGRDSRNRFSNRHRKNSPSPHRHAPRKSGDIYRWRRITKRESSSECEEKNISKNSGHSYKEWKCRRQGEGRILKRNETKKRYFPRDIDILREEVWKYNREKKCKNREKHSDRTKVSRSSTDVSDKEDLRLYLSAGSDLSSLEGEHRMNLSEEFEYLKDLGSEVLRMGDDELKSLLEKRIKDLEKCDKDPDDVAANDKSDDYFEEKTGKISTNVEKEKMLSANLDLEAITSDEDSNNDILSDVEVGHLTEGECSDHFEEVKGKYAHVTVEADLCPVSGTSLKLEEQVMKSCEPGPVQDGILDGKTEDQTALLRSKSDVRTETFNCTEAKEKRQHLDDYIDVVLTDTEFELNAEKVDEERTNHLNSVDSNDTTKSRNSFIHDFSMSDDEPETECDGEKRITILDVTIVKPETSDTNCKGLNVQEKAQQNQLSYSYQETQKNIVSNQVASDTLCDRTDQKCQGTGIEHQNVNGGIRESISSPRKCENQNEEISKVDKAENNVPMDSLNHKRNETKEAKTPRKKWEESGHVEVEQPKSSTDETVRCNQPSLIPDQQKPSFFDSPNTYIIKKRNEYSAKTADLETEVEAREDTCKEQVEASEDTCKEPVEASEDTCKEQVEVKEKLPSKDTKMEKPKKADKKKKTFKVKWFKNDFKKSSDESETDLKQATKRKSPIVRKPSKSTSNQISLLINAEKEKIGVSISTTTNSSQNVSCSEETATSEIQSTTLDDQNALLPKLDTISPRKPRRITPIKIGEVQSARSRQQSDSDCSEFVASLKRTYCGPLTDVYDQPEKTRKLNDCHQSPLPHMEEMLKTLETQSLCRETIEIVSADVERSQAPNTMNENSLPVINLDTKDLSTLGPLERNIFQNMTDLLATPTTETANGKAGENLNFSFYLKANSTTTSTPLKRQTEGSQINNIPSQSSVSGANNSYQNKKYLLAPLKRDRSKRVKCRVIPRPV